jgi:Raf kinase inhibitor-like YbhB/YbcL family protein
MVRAIYALFGVLLLTACGRVAAPAGPPTEVRVAFTLQSPAFAPGSAIPRQYTCDGADRSPPLTWSDLPAGTQSLALVVEDPDAPGGTFTHWVLYHLPPQPDQLPAAVPHLTVLTNGARQGRNDFRRVGYGGPCPPPGPPHHYHFRLYALATAPDLTPGASAPELRRAMAGQQLGETELIGTYGR